MYFSTNQNLDTALHLSSLSFLPFWIFFFLRGDLSFSQIGRTCTLPVNPSLLFLTCLPLRGTPADSPEKDLGMTYTTFFGCLLIAYGPPLAVFFIHVAPVPHLVILTISR